MALFFSCGGGRLGNQLLNLIHLNAFAYEYNLDVYKINDSFITAKEKSLFFKIEINKNNWVIVNDSKNIKKSKKLFLKIFIRIIHLYYFFHPNRNSYRFLINNNFHKFIFGIKLNKNFSIDKLMQEAKKRNTVISGWGLRDWNLVLKHKKSIIKNLYSGFLPIIDFHEKIEKDYLLVHIRRSDFLEIDEFKELNFSNEVWLKSILKVCKEESIKKIVIFSDSKINDFMISNLEVNKIDVVLYDSINNKISPFFEVFLNYLCNAKAVICNASTLVLSLSFVFHKNIYLPSKQKKFQYLSLDNAHNSYPVSLNWN